MHPVREMAQRDPTPPERTARLKAAVAACGGAAAFARASSISENTVDGWFKGSRPTPRSEHLVELARCSGRSPYYLLHGRESAEDAVAAEMVRVAVTRTPAAAVPLYDHANRWRTGNGGLSHDRPHRPLPLATTLSGGLMEPDAPWDVFAVTADGVAHHFPTGREYDAYLRHHGYRLRRQADGSYLIQFTGGDPNPYAPQPSP